MSVDRNSRGRDSYPAASRFPVFGGVADLVTWSRAKKSLLVSSVVLGLVFYATALLLLARSNIDRLPFIDVDILELQILLSYACMCAWVLLAAISFFSSPTHSSSRFFSHAPIQLYVVSNALFAYLFGFFTEPYGFVTVVGGMMVALPLFGAKPTRLGLVSWAVIFCVLTFLEQSGEIRYAPLLKTSPVVDGSISILWALGMGSINVTGGLLAVFFSFFVLGQLRKRDVQLLDNQAKLVEAVADLNDLTGELEESGRQLELRVEERTLELKVANRNLQFEIEAREKSAAELSNLRAAMEAAIEGAACVGFDGRIQTANAAYLAMHGVDASEMIGSSANRWVHADHRSELVKAAVELGHAEKIERNIVGLRGDGSAFPQFIAMVRVPDGEAGAHYRFARDVTRQNELSEQLNQAMKMEAIGRLAGGIAHDFNNLLMAILAAGDHLQEYFRGMAGAEEESEMADMIAMAGARAAALTTQLLDFAHVRPPTTVTIDVNQSVRNMLELVAPGLGKSIEVEADLSEESLLSPGDPSRFDSGLLNVALNAKDAMPEGGRLIVKTSAVTIDPEDPAFAGFQPRDENQLRIDMTDTGSGMDAETVAKVFDPFFTTKPAGKGTGLGLSVFSAYVREVGGALKIASSPGEGTTCSIYVPLSSDNSEAHDLLIATSDAQGSETILLAEDEHIVAQAIQRMLRNCGYKVIHCGDGLEAVDTYRERADDIDLVLLDFRMPVMTGAEAFLELRNLDPHVPVVLMSGNLSMSEFSALEEKGLNAILSKPCSREDLTQAIRKALRDSPKKS